MEQKEKEVALAMLTAELDLKSKEYNILCKEFDELKLQNLEQNDEKYVLLREKFAKNYAEIQKINNEIKNLSSSKAS